MSDTDGSQPQNDGTVIAVRGEAAVTVDPDVANIAIGMSVAADHTVAAADVGHALERLTKDLGVLGGVARTVSSDREALTWSTTSIGSHPEMDPQTHRPTGRTISAVRLEVRVRDFALLGPFQALVAGHSAVAIDHLGWSVDRTNPAWRSLRTEAVNDAVDRARQYAEALGGRLVRVLEIGDQGMGSRGPRAAVAFAAAGRPMQPPTIDPTPQVLSASVEARFLAAGIDLMS